MYYLNKFDDVISSGFWVISKNKICKFMQPIITSYIVPLPFALFNLEIVEGKKITKIWISQGRKVLFRWNKKHLS